MPERPFNPEFIPQEPLTETEASLDSEPKAERKKSSKLARKGRGIALGAMLTLSSAIGNKEAKAENPIPSKEDLPQLVVEQPDVLSTPETRKARGYPTRGLEGRKLGGLYSLYTGIKGEVHEFVDIQFYEQLEISWNAKIKHPHKHPELLILRNQLLKEYKTLPVQNMTLEDYETVTDKVLNSVRKDIDWSKVAEIKNLDSRELKVLKEIVGSFDGVDLIAYIFAELMPSRDGALNAEIFDFLLRNAGSRFVNSLPAVYDEEISFGPSQFTYKAMDDKGSNKGALVIDAALSEKHIPKTVAEFRGNDHQRAMFLFAIDNLATLIHSLSDKDLDFFVSNWRFRKDQINEFIAVGHTAPSVAISIGKQWIHSRMKKPYDYYAHGRYRDYALKAKYNLPALKKRIHGKGKEK